MATNHSKTKIESWTRPLVSIWLDTYDDVFSDFDSRPFSERSLSDDFISEARKMAKENPEGKIELKLLMPADKRNHETEAVIIKNLHSHFRHFARIIEGEIKQTRTTGYWMTFAGFLFMTAAAYVITIAENTRGLSYLIILRIILEPAGWFLVWTGLESIFFGLRKRKTELDFNLKMAHAEISFVSL